MHKAILTFIFVFLFFIFPQQANASFFYLSPQSSSVQKDSTFQVQVKLNTQDEVINGVSAFLAYPADKLQAISIDSNDELLPIQAEESIDDNVIKISRANLSSVNGDILVATITFKATAVGTALLQFIPGSAVPKTVDSQDSLNLSLSPGGSFQINESPNSTSAPSTPKPSDRKVVRCLEKEAANKARFNEIINNLNDTQAKFDTIFALVDDYYSNLGRTIPAYASQKKEVESKRNQALTNLTKLKTDIQSFSCNVSNPRENLSQIKKHSQITKDSFKQYKESVKKLIRTFRTER